MPVLVDIGHPGASPFFNPPILQPLLISPVSIKDFMITIMDSTFDIYISYSGDKIRKITSTAIVIKRLTRHARTSTNMLDSDRLAVVTAIEQ